MSILERALQKYLPDCHHYLSDQSLEGQLARARAFRETSWIIAAATYTIGVITTRIGNQDEHIWPAWLLMAGMGVLEFVIGEENKNTIAHLEARIARESFNPRSHLF